MLTIEEYLDRAKYIGRIEGMAETIEDEATRDGLYGDAEYLFGYLSEDARADYRFAERNEIDELLCQTPTAPAAAETNLDWLYHHPEKLVDIITCPYYDCPHMDEPNVGGDNVCKPCALNWLKEEHTDD
jgi:hypothetical protein